MEPRASRGAGEPAAGHPTLADPRPLGAVTSPPSSSAVTLSSEIAAIDQAKRALATGDASGALRVVDTYRSAFPQGRLAAEATALRIEALVGSGHIGEARAELAHFRQANPGSPLLETLTQIVGD